jgi:hypothetical protein
MAVTSEPGIRLVKVSGNDCVRSAQVFTHIFVAVFVRNSIGFWVSINCLDRHGLKRFADCGAAHDQHPRGHHYAANKIWQDADIVFKKSGTALSPITLRAQTPFLKVVFVFSGSRLRPQWRWSLSPSSASYPQVSCWTECNKTFAII